MILGSVAATDTTSNDTYELQSTDNQVVTSDYSDISTKSSSDSSNTKSISKVNTSNTNNSVKSSSSTASSTTTKTQSSTNIKVYNITSTKGSKVTFKSLITSDKGSYVKNGTVIYKINGKTIGNATVSNGGAKLTYTIPSTWTNINYTITAVYTGNSYYARSTSNSTLKLKSNTNTKVTVKDITATQGDKITLKAVITTSEGEYAKVGKVAFKINGKTVGTANVSNGGAKLTFTIPNNWKSQNYIITVVYGKNDYYQSSTSNGTLKIKGKVNPKIAINTTSVISGKSTTFVTTITDSNGNLVNGGKVAFKINGKTIGVANVTKGVAKLTYTIPSNMNGKYNISVVYGGYGNYNSITKTTTLNIVKQVSTKLTITTTSVISGKSTVLTAKVTDSSGNLVSGGKAVFKLNGKTIGTVNVNNGVAKLTYLIPSSWNGKYNITFVYGGQGKYLSSRKTTTLTVTKTSKTSTNKFEVPDGYESYVKSTKNCDVTNSQIKSLAASLTSGTTSAYTAAVKIFNYVRDKVSYTFYMNTRYGSVGTLNRKTGNCVDQAHLLIALMRASNIPARYCHATCTFSSGLVVGHVWAQVYVNGKWYSCDTTSSRNSFNNIRNWYKSTTVHRYTSLSF